MIENFIALIELIMMLGAGYGIASIFLKSQPDHDPLAIPVLGITFGLGIISYLTLLVASFHFLTSWFFWGVILIGNILLLKNRKQLKNPFIGCKITPLAVILIIFFTVNLFFSLFPPTFYDSLLYHLAIPQYYIQQGGIAPWNCNFNSNLPLNGEMLFLFSMLGGTVYIPKLISLWSGIAILILMLRWYKMRFSPVYPLLPPLLFYTIPQIGFLTSSSKTDMLGMLYLFSGLYLFFLYSEQPDRKRNLVLSGIFWGMAIGTKYIFGFYITALLITIALVKSLSFKKKVVSCLVISMMVLICLTPWFIKNTIICGNPVYPYLNSIFKSETWSIEQANNFSTALKRGDRVDILDLLYYPLELFLKPYKFGMTAVWGIFFLILFPFLFFAYKNINMRLLTLAAVLAFLTLLIFARVPRYFLSSLLLLSFPVAYGLEIMFKKNFRVKKIFIPIMIITMIIHLILQVDLQEKFFKGLRFLHLKMSKMSATINYLNIIPYYRAAEFINQELSADSRIIILGEDRTFYIKKKIISCSFADRHPIIENLKKQKKFPWIISWLKKQSITHILFSEKGLQRLGRLSNTYQLSKIQRETLIHNLNKFEILYRDNWCQLFKIK